MNEILKGAKHNLKPEIAAKLADLCVVSKQGFGSLRPSEDCYCVLGLLCELYRTEFPETASWKNGQFITNGLTGQKANKGTPPENVIRWATVNGCFPNLTMPDGEVRCLDGINDDRHVSFNDFAEFFRGDNGRKS